MRPTIFSEEINQKICQEYLDGMNITALRRKYITHERVIKRILLVNNIQPERRQYRNYQCNESIFNKIDSHEKAYWLGFLAGDGCIIGRTVCLELSTKDEAHVLKFRDFVQSEHPLRYFTKTCSLSGTVIYSIKLQINSIKMVNALQQYGVVPRKTFREAIPNIDTQYMNSFILGFWDADGSWTINKQGKTHYDIKSSLIANNKLAYDIQNIFIKELKLKTIKIIQSKESPKMFYLRYGGNKQVDKIRKFLYKDSPVWLERKKNILTNFFEGYYANYLESLGVHENEQEICQLFLENHSTNKTAKILKVGIKTVMIVLDRNNIPWRQRKSHTIIRN